MVKDSANKRTNKKKDKNIDKKINNKEKERVNKRKINTKNKETDQKIGKKENFVRVVLHSYDYKLLDSVVKNILAIAVKTNSKAIAVPLPTKRSLITILKSTFKHKDSQDQYEILSHSRTIKIISPKEETMVALRNISLPSGVDIELRTR